jgi:hypothetical protein
VTVPVSGSISLGLPTSSLQSSARRLSPLKFHKELLGDSHSILQWSRNLRKRGHGYGDSNAKEGRQHHHEGGGFSFCPLPNCPFCPPLTLRHGVGVGSPPPPPDSRASFSNTFEGGGSWSRNLSRRRKRGHGYGYGDSNSKEGGGFLFCPLPNCRTSRVGLPTKARASFSNMFESGSSWWREKRPNGTSSRKALESLRTHEHRGKFLKAATWLAAVLVIAASTLYAQSRARAYLERKVMPPLASIVSAHLGREVELGKVEHLSLLSVSLGPTSVGPHAEEFSCGEIPGIEIHLRPLKSLKRGQLVLDAVLRNPHALVAQKQDWSWLGIPAPAEKKSTKQSSEDGIDARTKVRREAREEMGVRMMKEREVAARLAAKTGYTTGEVEECVTSSSSSSRAKGAEKFGRKVDSSVQADSDFEDEYPEQHRNGRSSRGGKRKSEIDAGIDEDDFEEPTLAKDVERTFSRAKDWTGRRVIRPVKRKLLRSWSRSHGSTMTKSEYQNRNLQRSAVAARSMFESNDRDRRQKMLLSMRSKGAKAQGKTAFLLENTSSPPPSGRNDEGIVCADERVVEQQRRLSKNFSDDDSKWGAFDEFWGNDSMGDATIGSGLTKRVKGLANRLVRQAKRRVDVSRANGWTPVAIDTVYFRDGTFMLLGYGDDEAR